MEDNVSTEKIYCKGMLQGGLHLFIRCLQCEKFHKFHFDNRYHIVRKKQLIDPFECHRSKYKQFKQFNYESDR